MTPNNNSIFYTRPWFLRIFMAACFLVALGIRVYDLNDLPLDFHPARQLQSMLKARGMFLDNNAPAQMPQWQREMAVAQWKIQPTEEPEIVERLALWAYQATGAENLWFPRFFSIIFWLVGGIGLFLLISDLVGKDGAVVGTLFYLFLPYAVISSRAFMPDPLMVMFLIWGVWGLNHWHNRPGWGTAILAGGLCAMAILVKLTAIFMIAGAIFGLELGDRGFKKSLRNPQLWVLGILALLPAAIYNILGIYVMGFISQGAVGERILLNLVIDPLSYIRWDNKIEEVMGISALLLAIGGSLLLKDRRRRSLILGLWGGYLLFGVFFMYYYGTHDYYHMPLIPLVAIGLAAVGQTVIQAMRGIVPGKLSNYIIVGLLVLAIGQNTWAVRNTLKKADYSPDAAFWQTMGNKLRGYSVLALSQDYNGRLSYWGWFDATYFPSLGDLAHHAAAGSTEDPLQSFKSAAAGKDLFLDTMVDELDAQPELKALLYNTYTVFDQGQGYVIFDLRKPK
jgi:hypothetical protein